MSSFAVPAATEPISPELALVSPELAEAARARLPDRPWEAFLSAAAAVVPLRPPAAAESSVEAVEAPVVGHRRSPVPIGLILLVAFVGVVAAGSVLPVRDAPTLGPPPARANGLSVPNPPPQPAPEQPPVETTPARSTPSIPPAVPRRTTTTTSPPTAAPGKPLARAKNPKLVRPVARARGGYVLDGGIGVLRAAASGRSIAEIRTNVGCGPEVVTRRIAIAENGRFNARRAVAGPARATVSITGVFSRAGTVRGTIRVTRGHCVSGPVRFTGRLS